MLSNNIDKGLVVKLLNKPKIIWRGVPWPLAGQCIRLTSTTKAISHAYPERKRTIYKDEDVFRG